MSFSSPVALQIIHGSRNAFPKVSSTLLCLFAVLTLIESDFYKPTSPIYKRTPISHLFSIQDIGYYSALERNISGLYTKVAVWDLESKVDNCVSEFVHQLSKRCNNSVVGVDMSLWVHLFSFDCLGEINLSKKVGFLETGKDFRCMIEKAD